MHVQFAIVDKVVIDLRGGADSDTSKFSKSAKTIATLQSEPIGR